MNLHHITDELSKVVIRLTILEKEVNTMRKNFPKWAITGGFLAGIVVSFGHHLIGCTANGQLTPAGTVAVDSSVCVLKGLSNAALSCKGDWSCVEGALPGIAIKCAVTELQARQLLQAHLTAEEADRQYLPVWQQDGGQ